MENFGAEHNDLVNQLRALYEKHRELDIFITQRYNEYAPNEELIRLKTKKLWYKDEIHRLETNLRSLI